MLIKNNSGRVVNVSKEQADYMVAHGEGVVFDETPIVKEEEKAVEEKKVIIHECPFCGKICKNETGLKIHMKRCKKKS